MKLEHLIPLYGNLKKYQSQNWRQDILAGITVSVIIIPQGMAYAFLAGMPPIYGLYGALIPMLVYAFFGTSRKMSIGPVAISAILVLQGVSQLAEPFTPEYIKLVLLCGLLVGLLQVLLGLLKFGYLTTFISHPVISGFTSAAAIIIIINQLKDILGLKIPHSEFLFDTVIYAGKNLASANFYSVLIFAGSFLLMQLLKRVSKKIPYALIVVVLAIVAVKILDLENKGLAVIGKITPGLPDFSMPAFSYEALITLIPVVLTVTVIGIVESISIGKVLEDKEHSIEPNQEFIALGFAKILGSFFNAIPSSGSFSRSAVNDQGGAKTQVSSIFTVLMITITLLYLTPLFYFLPKAVLAAIIVMSLLKLFDYEAFKYLWKTHRRDFVVMFTTFLITLIFSIEAGVFAGILTSLLLVLYKSSFPRISQLGKVPGTTYYRNLDEIKGLEVVENKIILRLEDQLYFGNATYFKDTVKAVVENLNRPVRELVLDAKSIHEIDSSGIKVLEEILVYLNDKGIELKICGAMAPFRKRLIYSGLDKTIGEDQIFLYLDDAV